MRSTPAQRDQARALAVDLGLGEGWLDVLPLVTFSRPVLAVADLDGWSAADLHAVPGVGAERLARLVTAIRRRGDLFARRRVSAGAPVGAAGAAVRAATYREAVTRYRASPIDLDVWADLIDQPTKEMP